eukprot:TRINITY_DN606_c0_g1_i1.p1 TRINITY_DN606_c0_g1~~TRINITY_DN606_c0_g1_i1.p1  ORF type:complete len:1167 (-),score=154.21 TRINITY_DN606_c0_g1_i1:19546-23046(-)
MPAPSPNRLRERAAALHTHEDLLRDQLQFFREANAIEGSADANPLLVEQQYMAAASRRSDADTDSSVLLPTIEERPVSRRGRSRRNKLNNAQGSAATPFPHSFAADLSRPSVFARREKQKKVVLKTDGSSSHLRNEALTVDHGLEKQLQPPASRLTPAQEASSMLASMSLQQIRQAQQEIHDTLSPESILFLQQRSSRNVSLPSAVSRSLPSQTNLSPRRSHDVTTPEAKLRQHAADEKEREEQVERAKRLWMTDATETLQTQDYVDEILQKAVEDMGPVATERFDLDGNILTKEQIHALPTHKGLHHHGTAPESAGYTLADLLILTRSTILSQRVVALKVLIALITTHGERVIEPMLKSDAIRLVFSQFPASESFHRALTNQVAYLEAVECLLRHFGWLEQHMLVRDHYFASEFYSSVLVQGDEYPLFTILSEMHCICTLVDIAKARCTALSSVQYSKRALNAIRMILFGTKKAAQAFLEEGESTSSLRLLDSLMHLAVGPDKLDPSTTMLSCEIIAHIYVNSAWVKNEKQQEIVKGHFSEDFLMETAVHLNWVLRYSPFELQSAKQEAAKGVLRLFRAYISQSCGTHCISAYLQAICRLAQEADDDIGIEAYLLLEAFVHCLATKIMRASSKELTTGEHESDRHSSATVHTEETSLTQFAMDQLSGLIPQVVAAAKIVVTPGNRHSTPRRAAAGHFVATVLTVMPIPFDETYYNRVKCTASEADFKIVKSGLDTERDLKESQTFASLSHATARILNGKPIDKGFVRREVDRLANAAEREKKLLSKTPGHKTRWRLIANACAEWIGLQSRSECMLDIVRTASVLLTCLNDVQVILDLTSRCILRKEILLTLRRETEASEAHQIARKFVPLTWKLINDSGKLCSTRLQELGDQENSPVMISLDSLVDLWLKHDGLNPEGLILCRSLFQSDLLDNSLFFETLIEVSSSQRCTPHALFDLLLEVGISCFEREGHLIRSASNTRGSSLSTSMDSQFFTSVVSLADQLVARGPVPMSPSKGLDSLGSIILSIMCGLEADSTLRQNLWNRCVQECGGAALFEKAVFVQSGELDTTSSVMCLEREDMMHRYVSAIGESFLDHGRCPEIMRKIVLHRLSAYLSFPANTATLNSMLESLPPASRKKTLDKLSHILSAERRDGFELLAKWVQDVR